MELYLPESRLLLDILCGRLPSRSDKLNYAGLVRLAENHDLAAIIFYRLQKSGLQLPETDYSLLRSRYLNNVRINLRLWNEFLRINGEFEKNNIDMVPIKGMDILARFYPAIDLRSMVDIDILIKEEQFERAQKVLCALGYHKELFNLKEDYWRSRQCHVSFYNKNRVIVELHWGLDFKRGNGIMLPKLWGRMKKTEISGHKINLLSPEDAIFSLALHLRRYGHILSLKQVFDAARIVKESAGFDWEYVLEESGNGRTKAAIYFILTQVGLFTETPIPGGILERLQLALWQKILIKRLIERNTFKIPASMKKNYLKAHFLLYDDLFEPVYYLMNIPYEQFCKFYDLKPYTRKADILYRLRIPYMAVSLFRSKED